MTQPTENRTQEGLSSVQAGDLANQLKAIRERLGFDQDKAAEQMHLSRNIVVTLENEDFANLPEPPYVRGYLRSYARLGEVDAAPLIRAYETLRGADPDAMAKHFAPTLNQPVKPRISPDAARMGVIAVVVLLLVLISMIPAVRNWAQETWTSFAYKTQQDNLERQKTLAGAANPGENSPEASSVGTVTRPNTPTAPTPAQSIAADTPSTATNSLASATPAVNSNVPATTTSTNPNPAANTTTPSTATTAPANTASTSTTSNPPATLANGLPNPAVPLAEAVQATAPQPTTNKPTNTIVPTAATTATTPPATPTTPAATTTPADPGVIDVAIRAEFAQEVWMQIKDAKGKRIFEVLGAPNTSKELNAKTPMTFKIGNAPGVKLFLNGQPYDLAPYTRGSVATFKVE